MDIYGMTLEAALQDFSEFWEKYFPEQRRLTRAGALAEIDEPRRGQANTAASDAEMVGYQNDVARVYGAYELACFQQATAKVILPLAKRIPAKARVVSLGSGPASYELWLASKTNFWFTLVDHSPGMLARAREIATAVGISERISFIQSDAASVPGIVSESADWLLCLNSMHWSRNWRQWIAEAARIVKPKAYALFTYTFFLRRSRITPEELAQAMSPYFTHQGADQLVPPVDVGGGMVMKSGRFWALGQRRKSQV